MEPATDISERIELLEQRLAAFEEMQQRQQTLLARLEQHLIDLKIAQQHQDVNTAHLLDVLTGGQNRADWDHVQAAQLLRILTRDVRELRASLICSLLSDGPISVETLQGLLRTAAKEEPDLQAIAEQSRSKK
ncbi:MAG TPA: DUF3294 domain-containing protein [Roseiflexaceae bacterium]|nr:DUF3294 domain-containing protein [Roseiflexaceae bacterium]